MTTTRSSSTGSCAPDAASKLISIAASSIPDGSILIWNFRGSDGSEGRGHHVNGTYKQLELEPAGLSARTTRKADGAYEITLASKGLALFVMIEASVAGRFSDNAFDMTAGESRTITFTPEDAGATAEFTIRDLHSCQTAD